MELGGAKIKPTDEKNMKIISFEGPFGCGKTTQIYRVYEELKRRRLKVFVKPGGGGLVRRLNEEAVLYDQYFRLMGRHLSLKKKITRLLRVDPKRFYFTVDLPLTESFLVIARYALDWEKIVLPLERRTHTTILLADRDIDTFYAHQLVKFSEAKSFRDKKQILEQIRRVVLTWFRDPDLTFYIRVSAKEARRRLNAKGTGVSHPQDIAILRKSVENYDFLAKCFKNRFVVIDGHREENEITKEIIKELMVYLNKEGVS
ncbi:MAG: hypothetical protein QXP45_02480 [Thermoproteota archaeon]